MMWRWLGVAVLAVSSALTAAGCGGNTVKDQFSDGSGGSGGSSSGGGAGFVSGNGGSVNGGGGAHGGAGGTSADACSRDSDCVVVDRGCCSCEPVSAEGLVAESATNSANVHPPCMTTCPICLPSSEPPVRGYFKATCTSGHCALVDLRMTAATTCTRDSDCQLRSGNGCCQSCTGPLIAVNDSMNFCPDGPLPCPLCAVQIPPGTSAVCDSGRCAVQEPTCTAANPCP